MTTLCLISGAISLGICFLYIVLRIGCWAEGRKW
jgi:hypothetical protein